MDCLIQVKLVVKHVGEDGQTDIACHLPASSQADRTHSDDQY